MASHDITAALETHKSELAAKIDSVLIALMRLLDQSRGSAEVRKQRRPDGVVTDLVEVSLAEIEELSRLLQLPREARALALGGDEQPVQGQAAGLKLVARSCGIASLGADLN